MHDHGAVELRGKIGLVGRSEVASPFEFMFQRAFGLALLKYFDGLVISDPREGRLGDLQLADVTPYAYQLGPAALQAALDNECDKAFGQVHEVFESGVGDLGLDHPELSEVTAGL